MGLNGDGPADLVVAVWDTEVSRIIPPNEDGTPNYTEDPEVIGALPYACGVTRILHIRKVGTRKPTVRVLAENVYFDPLAQLRDLLDWRVHVTVCWRQKWDLPSLVHNALPPAWGLTMRGGVPESTMARVKAAFAEAVPPTPLVIMPSPEDVPLHPEARAIDAWDSQTQGHNVLVPRGVAGGAHGRPQAMQVLEMKTFDPSLDIARQLGGTRGVKLDHLRDCLNRAGDNQGLPPFRLNGRVVESHAIVEELWASGRQWDVVAMCRYDVQVLSEVLLTALAGLSLSFDECYDGDPEPFRNPDGNRHLFTYSLPTDTWWSSIQAIGQGSIPC